MASNGSTISRASAVLTTSYVGGTIVQAGDSSRIDIVVDFTLQDLTSLDLLVKCGTDQANMKPYSVIKADGGTITVYPGTFKFLPADWGQTAASGVISLEIASPLIQIFVKGTGTVAGSLCAVTVVEGNDA